MNKRSYELCIQVIEDYYCDRMSELVDQGRLEDSDSIFREFVLDSENPDEWTFLEDLTNVF